ncbi:tripartite tricarboxylate transporter substrate binding protein [Achromobacter pestifer]|uniref:Tripartite tricarboxylate transporter substrate binding protein n=1 Tax=Achromobacter pestifer TaxID=1353889 RepID=A0A7D4E1P1_9BURK|nr:tripartite tricarboxylate transporter substrate binding protein [Achromobacter pestifer]QKH36829.1 tripartite tricarboxylate transporter substrate binding protein [Achromobacter pestifer]
MKKHIRGLIVFASLCCVTAPAWAQSDAAFPTKPIRLIVPSPAGGEPDTLARLVAQQMSADLRQPVIVENKAGAGGLIGIAALANSKPDGYTIGVSYQAALSLSPHLLVKKLFDPLTDIAGIGLISVSGNALMVPAKSPISSYADLVQRAKASPGTMNFGSWGDGSAGHISGEIMKRHANISIQHVAYKGSSEALMGMLGGDLDATFGGWALASAQAKAGAVRILAVTSPERASMFPDAPTFLELGIPFGLNSWYGVIAPAGVPAPIVQRLQASVERAVGQESVAASLKSMGMQPQSSTAAELQQRIKNDYEVWGKEISAAGIKPR